MVFQQLQIARTGAQLPPPAGPTIPHAITLYAAIGGVPLPTNMAGAPDITGSTVGLNGVSFIDANTGFVCGDGGNVYVTTNGGSAFSSYTVLGSPSTDFLDIEVWSEPGGDGMAGFLVGEGGAVYKKTNSVTRFEPVTTSPVNTVTADLYDVEVLSQGATVRIGGRDGVTLFFDSSSGNWTLPKGQVGRPLYKMSFDSAGHGYGIGGDFVIIEFDT